MEEKIDQTKMAAENKVTSNLHSGLWFILATEQYYDVLAVKIGIKIAAKPDVNGDHLSKTILETSTAQ